MRNKLQFLVVLMCLITTPHAQATLIDNGDVTFDTTTNLEWLDLTLTINTSYDDIITGFGGYSTDGWTHATQSQVCDLLDNSGPGEVWCTGGINTVQNSIAMVFGVELATKLGYTFTTLGTVGFYDSGLTQTIGNVGSICIELHAQLCSGGIGLPRVVRRLNSGFTTATPWSVGGHFLVRSTNVPEPSTLAIFALGMIGFASRRFKKQS